MPSPVFLVVVLAMSVWAVYRQTRASAEAPGAGRFRLALIYAAVGVLLLVRDGWTPPAGAGWALLIGGVLLSAVVGVVRGLLTRVWLDADGRRWRQGTWLTVTLFVLVVAAKVVSGYLAARAGIESGSGSGEVLIVVAVMVALQAQVVHVRRPGPVPATVPA